MNMSPSTGTEFTRFFFFQAEDGIRDLTVTGVQTCALPIFALGLRQTRRDFPPMEEVTHDPVRDRPVVTVDAVMMRAQARVARELQTARCAEAHAPAPSEGHANLDSPLARDSSLAREQDYRRVTKFARLVLPGRTRI